MKKIISLILLISTISIANDDYISLLKSLQFTQKIGELDLKDGKKGRYLNVYDNDSIKINESYFVLKSIFIDQCEKTNGEYKYFNKMTHTKTEKVQENFVINSIDICFDKNTNKPKYDIFKKQIMYKDGIGKNFTSIIVGDDRQALFDLSRIK